jgi:hypothetical protein
MEKTMFKAEPLSSAAIEVMMQLFVTGPVWDGNVVSKAGRGDLVKAGLAFHDNGWCSLTEEGVRVAVGWDRNALSRWHDQRWINKLRAS